MGRFHSSLPDLHFYRPSNDDASPIPRIKSFSTGNASSDVQYLEQIQTQQVKALGEKNKKEKDTI